MSSKKAIKKIEKKIEKLGTVKKLPTKVKIDGKVKTLIQNEEKILKGHLEKLEVIKKSFSGEDSEDSNESGEDLGDIDICDLVEKINKQRGELESDIDLDGKMSIMKHLQKDINLAVRYYEFMKSQFKVKYL